MKKIFSTLAVAGMLFVMAACSSNSSNPAEKAAKIINDFATKIENAKSAEDIDKIKSEYGEMFLKEEYKKLDAELKDYNMSSADSVKLAQAMIRLFVVCKNKNIMSDRDFRDMRIGDVLKF